MATVDPSYRDLIQFIPQRSKDDSEVTNEKPRKDLHDTNHSGNDIKQFYESLINEDFRSEQSVPSLTVALVTTSKQNDAGVKRRKIRKKRKSKSVTSDQICDKRIGSIGAAKTTDVGLALNSTVPTSSCAGVICAPTLDRRQRMHAKLLQSAQMGELHGVIKLLKESLNINHQDFYGWTPLMCAAKEGHDEVVTYLLLCGADRSVCNSNGQTAYMLASASGHKQLAQSILDFSLQSVTSDDLPEGECETRAQTYFCGVCKAEFSSSEQQSHETSLIHLFNNGHKPKGPSYLIPENNLGFQMLLRTGWDKDKGLGPKGEGLKYPVKTVLKQDRKGLGVDSDKKKAKVTHFNPNDKAAVRNQKDVPQRRMTARRAARVAEKLKEKRNKRQEQKLRFELSGGYE